MLSEVLPHALIEIGLHRAEAVGLAGRDQEVKALVGFDQCVHHANGVGGMDVVIHIAMNQEQMALEVGGHFRVRRNVDFEVSRTFFLGFVFLVGLLIVLLGVLHVGLLLVLLVRLLIILLDIILLVLVL